MNNQNKIYEQVRKELALKKLGLSNKKAIKGVRI